MQRLAERLAGAFGDTTAFPRLRETLANPKADMASRRHAFAVLSRAQDRASLPTFFGLLDEVRFARTLFASFARFGTTKLASAILDRFNGFPPADRLVALEAMTSRPLFALALLDAWPRTKSCANNLRRFT